MTYPVWVASAVFGLASRTGWDPFFILDCLPLSQFFAYQHAALRADGAWTVPVAPSSPLAAPPPALDRAQIQAAESSVWDPTW